MILTAIVINMGIAAFVLALIYRSYRLTKGEEVSDDPEDTRVSQLTDEDAVARDEDLPEPDKAKDTDAPDELEPLDDSVSDTTRMTYGKSFASGSTATRARSARAP